MLIWQISNLFPANQASCGDTQSNSARTNYNKICEHFVDFCWCCEHHCDGCFYKQDVFPFKDALVPITLFNKLIKLSLMLLKLIWGIFFSSLSLTTFFYVHYTIMKFLPPATLFQEHFVQTQFCNPKPVPGSLLTLEKDWQHENSFSSESKLFAFQWSMFI